ncbi:MAG: carbohydrate kinase family protein [Lachnospiraceae bacterium]|nr:carbohydrate kinase family protein [Lachnospiraceae bacterium]
MNRFLLAGITQIETIVKVDKVPVDYVPLVNKPGTIFTDVGGDAYNESLALKWLGDDVMFLTFFGRNQDISLMNPPHHEISVPTNYVQRVNGDTPLAVVLVDDNREEQIFEDIKDIRDCVYDKTVIDKLVPQSDFVVLANANFCRPILEEAIRHNKKIAVNIRNFSERTEVYSSDFLKAASVLYFSDDDIGDADPFEFVAGMGEKYGTDVIIMGQGGKGLVLYDRKLHLNAHYNTVNINEVVNAVGAGNALYSCFLHYYAMDGDSVNAIKMALLFASYKVGYMGTSMGFMTTEQLDQWKGIIWREDRLN